MPGSQQMHATNVDVVVVGAGFSGLYMLFRLRALGLVARCFEAGSDVGGTWYWNRYPGARCDVESMQYSYSFNDALQQDWRWSEIYSAQPEILSYARHVADRLDLRPFITFDTRVTSATFDEAQSAWTVRTDTGASVTARFVVMATGCLSTGQTPDIAGREFFAGPTYHTGSWPHEGIDFSGKRVAVIGTGSSGIQAIPAIAKQAAHLTVFQRTANFSVPARNGPLPTDYEAIWKADYANRRQKARTTKNGILLDFRDVSALNATSEEREREYAKRWSDGGFTFMAAYNDLALNHEANETAAEFVRARIREQVKNPTIAKKLVPNGFPIGTKRLCVDTDYFATFNRANVTLVDIHDTPIEAITANGLRVAGQDYVADAIVFATGFDAMTGSLTRVDIRGRARRSLKEKWDAGPHTYLGLMTAEFPNLFMITGPGSPSVLTNMMVSIEQHVDWIADCLGNMIQRGNAAIEATQQAEDAWVAHVNEVAFKTLYPEANSWYMGANVPGKARCFLPYIGGVAAYREKCDSVAANGYEGFRLTPIADTAADLFR